MRPLTDRQREFIRAYLDMAPTGGRLCATRAARLAGYAWPDRQGPRLMTFPHVAAEVERRFVALLEARRQAWEAEKARRYAESVPKVRGHYGRLPWS